MAELKGAAAMRKTLETIGRALPKVVGRAMYEEALIIQGVSMRRTPVWTGALRASHETTRPTIDGRDVSVSIKVGGPSAPYALFVHENMEAHHKVGQPKFLESAILEARPDILGRIARRIKLNEATG